jgi:Glycosyl hydrolase family 12
MRFSSARSLSSGACGILLAACSSAAATDFSSASSSAGTGGTQTVAGGSGNAAGSVNNAGAGGALTGGAGTGTGAGGSAGAVSGGAGGSGGSALGGSAGDGAAGSSGVVHTGCTPGTLSDSGALMSRFDSKKVMAGGVEYFMQVNEWNTSAAQTMTYGGAFFFKMTEQGASTATNGGPTGFPSMFIGANSRNSTANSNLPKLVSSLTSVPTTWNWNDNGTLADATANSYNAAYDVWFSTNPMGEPNASGPSGGFLMVWLHKPADAQPIGKILYPAVTIAGVAGTWDVWIGMNGRVPCTSYVRTADTLSLSYDLNDFIKDAVSNRTNDGTSAGTAVIQNGWYLTNIFSGFEIWRGGVNLETTSFCAVVN